MVKLNQNMKHVYNLLHIEVFDCSAWAGAQLIVEFYWEYEELCCCTNMLMLYINKDKPRKLMYIFLCYQIYVPLTICYFATNFLEQISLELL